MILISVLYESLNHLSHGKINTPDIKIVASQKLCPIKPIRADINQMKTTLIKNTGANAIIITRYPPTKGVFTISSNHFL